MGFKIACLAVDMADKKKALIALGLKETRTPDEYNEMPYSGGVVGNGKYVIWKNDKNADFNKSERSALKNSVSFISMGVHEGVMSGHVDQISNGKIDWRIEYVGCENPTIFTTKGQVPAEIIKLHKHFKAKSDASEGDVDLEYEILSESFKHFTGHKYDMDSGFDFFQLELTSSDKKKAWWKFF